MTKPANQNAKSPATSPAASQPGTAAVSSGKGAPLTSPPPPKTWSEIQLGSLVIAQEDDIEDGWWEAVVTEVRDDALTLRWRDYPRQAPVTGNRKDVALLFSGA